MASPEKAPVGYTNGTSFAWNTKGEVIAAAAILPFLGIVLVALRFYNRMKHKTGIGADDWLIVPAAVEFIIYVIMVPAYGFIKLSVIYFYRRIFVKGFPDSRFNIVTHVTSVIVVIWTIVFFFLEIFKRGSYIPDNWGPLIKAKQGINGAVLNNGLFISDFITDLWIVLLPIPLIVRLNMSRTKKLTVVGVLLLGAMSFCAAIVRMVFNIQIVNAGLAKKTDVNMGLTTLMYWSMVEAGLSLIAANLPSVYSLFSQNASLQSTFSSLRSKLALRSFRSTDGLRGSSKEKPYEQMDATSSDGSSHKHALKEKESFSSNYIYTGHKMGAMPQGATVSVRSDLESQCLQGKGGLAV
ncbi:MAG: hypothetical protein LQ337_003715 [Flavoplaca oasis]|nr:MAG: hypothetical protein LQ337_003715 [Flavoplaca oasis]